jgi:hypothetical protein
MTPFDRALEVMTRVSKKYGLIGIVVVVVLSLLVLVVLRYLEIL